MARRHAIQPRTILGFRPLASRRAPAQPTVTCETYHRAYQRIIQGIGMMSEQTRLRIQVRHNICHPVPVNEIVRVAPAMLRQNQRVQAARTQAHPMIVIIERARRMYQPRKTQYPPVNERGRRRPSELMFLTTHLMVNKEKKKLRKIPTNGTTRESGISTKAHQMSPAFPSKARFGRPGTRMRATIHR